MGDRTEALRESVLTACRDEVPLSVTGAGSKGFYGRAIEGRPLPVSGHQGVVSHDPRELVLTARAGTPLREVESVLASEGQMLPFEPPHFGAATLGGAIASGLSGPRRPFAGAARDYVLGTRILNGRGEVLRFGGEVIKNVAGYDVSRLMVGALGTLGVLLEVSLKVSPRPEVELTVVRECTADEGIDLMQRLAGKPVPLSAACHLDGRLWLRLSGAASAVEQAAAALGDSRTDAGTTFWADLREHRLPFFGGDEPLWRLSVPADTPADALPGPCLVDWAGAQRWLRTDAPPDRIRALAEQASGHAQLFRRDERNDVFHPLPSPLMKISRRLKAAFDPHGILNPGKIYAGL